MIILNKYLKSRSNREKLSLGFAASPDNTSLVYTVSKNDFTIYKCLHIKIGQ